MNLGEEVSVHDPNDPQHTDIGFASGEVTLSNIFEPTSATAIPLPAAAWGSMVVMPLTYYPILKTASDKNVMGKHVNSRFDTIVGTIFLVLIAIAAVAAIPLMVLTHRGKP